MTQPFRYSMNALRRSESITPRPLPAEDLAARRARPKALTIPQLERLVAMTEIQADAVRCHVERRNLTSTEDALSECYAARAVVACESARIIVERRGEEAERQARDADGRAGKLYEDALLVRMVAWVEAGGSRSRTRKRS